MTRKIISSQWDTERLVIKDLLEEDIETMQKLYEQGSYRHKWDGQTLDKEYVYRCFTVGDLPPNGSKENFKIQAIHRKDTNSIVGILTSYHGFPNAKTFYINYLYIDQKEQKQGFGREVITRLLDMVKENEYVEVRANVALKNWTALRFWTSLGLNKINGIFGDKELSPDSFADVELCKEL
ncbi:GNAT family N-acetyltransferase [Bacillus alkalicellulosilyticus]|uniref:GNAT family N-acetyltransferase n=1 Tax=Alkalihalobacterium alkalicellulosilyticum TaxID=1912214 RepID=UPI0009960EF2|nr:GNAT family N-acetyltransferase [Bacillus alkalicellulosilyticus]